MEINSNNMIMGIARIATASAFCQKQTLIHCKQKTN